MKKRKRIKHKIRRRKLNLLRKVVKMLLKKRMK